MQQIAERCQQGDREAFALLYTAMRQPLRAVCLGYVHNEAVADDLLHDAFLLIFFQIGKLKDTARAESWMTMLTRRVSLLYLRQQKRQLLIPMASNAATALRTPAVENLAESTLAVQEILAAVDALPDGYRRVFRLFVLEGMTHQEIAAMLHIDPHSSASQLYHAKALLRQRLRHIVLLLLAAAVPVGFWHWHAPTKRTDMKPIPVVADNGKSIDNPNPGISQPLVPVGTDSCICSQRQIDGGQIQDDGEHHASCDTTGKKDSDGQIQDGDRQIQEHVPAKEKEGGKIPTRGKGSGDWLLAVTYSGTGKEGELRLPYVDADTNPMVYDSVAHHHRPLTVGLMLNRRLGEHWQFGIGLNYQRMTSDMLSGNSFVTLSQHQVVQYIGLPVSVSWHYPLGRSFCTYLSLSASVSMPLRSTLESIYIIDGLSYEPSTERLRPSMQWQTGIGIGLQYNLTPHIGFFAEPGLHYHFKGSGDNVRTWNTEHPFDFSVPLGLRISF